MRPTKLLIAIVLIAVFFVFVREYNVVEHVFEALKIAFKAGAEL